ncbi:MAG: DUF6482 family protein [Neptuniibacter sp.]
MGNGRPDPQAPSTPKLPQSLFTQKMVGEMVLCHQSAYDEMVGQPMKEGGNMLEVPLGNSSLSV